MCKPYVIVRCRNDMPTLERTLEMLSLQDTAHELLVFDNMSSDGSQEVASRYATEVIAVDEYVPGRVLNEGMRKSHGEIVAFLNSDCVPVDKRWLTNLLAGFKDPTTAAVFGRQVAGRGDPPLYAKDVEECFGRHNRQSRCRHFFSMASSAIRRSVWQQMSFSETLMYSEDVDWTWRTRQRGCRVQYAPDSVVEHAHSYGWSDYYGRQFGEGFAEATIFQWTDWQRSLLRYSLIPYGRQVVSDWRYCLKKGYPGAALQSVVYRAAQLLGRRAGFRAALAGRSRSSVRRGT